MSAPAPATRPTSPERALGDPIKWYRCPVSKEDLAKLNQRSDVLGMLQTLGFLGILAATGTAAFMVWLRFPWYASVPLCFLHAACWHFLINGFHELIHDSVFKTRALNRFFLWVFSFLGQYNHLHFWASHTEHHKFTLHAPDDLEVVLPQSHSWKGFFKGGFVNIKGPWWSLKNQVRRASGQLMGAWDHHLFDDNPRAYRNMVNWQRFVLAGHAAIVGVSCYYKLWIIPFLITLAPHYGGGLHFLCNGAQHIGLCDYAPDFRLCCRTIYLNPILQFLYWHMNYHTEHHMYAAVPCYKLPKLHRLIKHDMPPCPNGLYETWKGIDAIIAKQKMDPKYQFVAELPKKGVAPAAVASTVGVKAEAVPAM